MAANVIVVGAGAAGMAAASALAHGGAKVTVLEKDHFLGGRWGTMTTTSFEQDDRRWEFPIEHGIHGFWRQYRNLRALLARHGLDRHMIDSGRQELALCLDGDRIRFLDVGDTVRNSPLPDPFAFAGLLADREFLRLVLRANPLAMVSMARDMGHVFAFDPAKDIEEYDQYTVLQLVRNWPPFMRSFFRSLVHMAFFLELDEAALGAFMTSLQHYTVCDKRDISFNYLGDTTEACVFRPIADFIESRGGRVLTNNHVEEVVVEDGRVCGVMAKDARGRRRRLKADACILAVDPPAMKALQVEGLPDVVLGDPPEAIASNTVRFWFSGRPAPERATNGMVSGPNINNYFWVSSIQRPFVEWAEATGGSAIEAHQYGAVANKAANQTDAELMEGARRRIEEVWPGVAGTCVHQHLVRSPPGHPDFSKGVWNKMPPVRTKLPNLAICGDWVGPEHHVFFLERCATTGLEAARTVAPAIGVDTGAMPELIPAHPASSGFKLYQHIAQVLRRQGLLPSLDR